MEDDSKSRMDGNLKQKLDSLYAMKMQPAFHVTQRMDEIINAIDYDAELLMAELETKTEPAEDDPTSLQVNEARCELVRILKAVEQKLHAQLLADELTRVDRAFDALVERFKEFQSTTFSPGDDINDLEDSYVQLLLEITEMSNTHESRIFGGQAIFYVSSIDKNKLGSLFHLSDVFLAKEQIDVLR